MVARCAAPRQKTRLAAALLLLTAAGCPVGPTYVRPEAPLNASWSAKADPRLTSQAPAKVWANGLVVLVLQLLSGGSTPVESQPKWLQTLTYLLPSRHFVSFSQVIIYRGGGLGAVWRQFAMVGAVGFGFFAYSVARFRKSIAVSK
jgi:hypothetical protein